MIIYLAARYSRNEEMRGYRDFFTRWGHEVTSRWIDCHPDITGDPQLEASFTPGFLTSSPELARPFGEFDIEDLDRADTFICFTSTELGSKGGHHVEFGYALKAGKQMIVIGPRVNVFHTLPQVKHFNTWDEFETVFAMSHLTTDPDSVGS